MVQGPIKQLINLFFTICFVFLSAGIYAQPAGYLALGEEIETADTLTDPVIGTPVSAEHSSVVADIHAEHATGAEKFDPGRMISDHISDSHDWHLWGHTHIPLPVILYTANGLEVFSSSNFRNHETHQLQDYIGKHHTYRLDDEKVKVIVDGMHDESAMLYDISITKNVVSLFFVTILMLYVFISIAGAYTKRKGKSPKGLQSLLEPIILFIRDDIAKPSIGKKYARFMPYLLSVFFFILFANLLGLIPIIPGGSNLTGNIAITLTLAVLTFVITTVKGNKHYWKHIFAMPGVPGWVLILLTPIEILGMFLRPFVLMIRLFANITAGHIISLSFFSLIFIFGNGGESAFAGIGVGIGSYAFTVFITALEILVAFLQAYVFTLLSAIYFGSAVEDDHHEHQDATGLHPDPELQSII